MLAFMFALGYQLMSWSDDVSKKKKNVCTWFVKWEMPSPWGILIVLSSNVVSESVCGSLGPSNGSMFYLLF